MGASPRSPTTVVASEEARRLDEMKRQIEIQTRLRDAKIRRIAALNRKLARVKADTDALEALLLERGLVPPTSARTTQLAELEFTTQLAELGLLIAER